MQARTVSVPQKESAAQAADPENVLQNPFPPEVPTPLSPDAPLWPHSPIAPSKRFEREVRQKRANRGVAEAEGEDCDA